MNISRMIFMLGIGALISVYYFSSRKKLSDIFLKSALHSSNYSSELLAYYTKGHDLLNVANGELEGMFFDIIITSRSSIKTEPWSKAGSTIYSLRLNFDTEAHLVGVSNKIRGRLTGFGTFLSSTKLEKVDLEGDFPSYFSLYAAKGQGAHARYIFDPEMMAFVVDYCQEFFWEIVGDTLYFVAESNHESGNFVKSSIEFVKQIEPAIKREFKNKEARINERRRTHKKENIGDPLNCPVCNSTMTLYEYFQECPNGHGRLLQANILRSFRSNNIESPPILNTYIRDSDKALICPSCYKEMQIVNYAQSGINIDACTNTSCLYRWLDAGELTKIIARH